MLCYRKPKNARTKRLLEKRSPKQIENPKQAVLVRSSTASAQTQSILADFVLPDNLNILIAVSIEEARCNEFFKKEYYPSF
jgi:hypothetical protein